MTKRQAEKAPRDPHGWYVEPRSAVEQLADAIDFGDSVIWDPSCGGGTIPSVFEDRGHIAIGSDIVERPRWFRGSSWRFYPGNFLNLTKWPTPPGGRKLSIVCNPPYNEPIAGIAEMFVHRALNMGEENPHFFRAAFILPIEFACSQGRYERLYSKRPPSHVCFYSERPSMPPGQVLRDRGEDARGGGMADYVALVWTAGGPYRTEALFLKPSNPAAPPESVGRVRRDRNRPANGRHS